MTVCEESGECTLQVLVCGFITAAAFAFWTIWTNGCLR
jgi:hypothetical protein